MRYTQQKIASFAVSTMNRHSSPVIPSASRIDGLAAFQRQNDVVKVQELGVAQKLRRPLATQRSSALSKACRMPYFLADSSALFFSRRERAVTRLFFAMRSRASAV